MSKQKGLLHQETYKTIKKCLRAFNKEENDRFGHHLKSKQGIFAKIRYWIYSQPIIFLLVSCVVVFLFVYLLIMINTWIISKYIDNNFVRLIISILFVLFYFFITICLKKIIPRYFMGWDERWSRIMGTYLHETSFSEEQAKTRLQRAILYYQREGKYLKYTTYSLSTILISIVFSDSSFQKALIRASLEEMFKTNPLVTILMGVLPFVWCIFWIGYGSRIDLLENVFSQIKIKEI